MPWQSFLPWSNTLKTRACRQLLQHYLGAFFEEKLSLDQLSIDVFSGSGKVKDIVLNLNAINELLSNNNIPLEVVKAYVGEINISIPWTSILNENSALDIKELEITVRPKRTVEQNTAFELSTMLNSMNTSMMIAKECLKNETEEDTTYQGLETFAATIDSILARVRVTLTDTIIRFEHLVDQSENGVALQICVKRFEYYDSEAESIDMSAATDPTAFIRPTAYANKIFLLSGVTFYTDEFSISGNSESMITSCKFTGSIGVHGDTMVSSVLANSPSMVLPNGNIGYTRMFGYKKFDPILCLTISGKQEIRLKLKQSEKTNGPNVEIHAYCGSLNCLLTPRQLKSLIILFGAYQEAALSSTDSSNLYKNAAANNRPMTDEDFRRIESNLAEEVRRRNYQMQHPQMDPDYHAYGDDFDPTMSTTDSMFCSVQAMSTSIDLESSYTSSRPDTLLSPNNRHRLSASQRKANSQATVEVEHLEPTMRRMLENGQAVTTTEFQLQFTFISLCLLHQDVEKHDTSLRSFSDAYFANISMINTSSLLDERQINEYHMKYSQACSTDHLSIIGKSLTIGFSQKAAENCLCLDLNIRLHTVDVCECLRPESSNLQAQKISNDGHSRVFNRILTFPRPSETSFDTISGFQSPYNSLESAVVINVTNFDINEEKRKKSNSAFSRRLSALRPFSNIKISLGNCQIDFDISILDRIHASIDACQSQSTPTSSSTESESLVILNVNTSSCLLHLRFPIADLQPIDKRRPWWIQGVHQEILSFDIKKLQLCSNFVSDESRTLIVTSEEIQLYYSPSPTSDRSNIGRLSSSDGKNIKIIVNLNDPKDLLTQQQFNNLMTDTLFDSVINGLPKHDDKLPLRIKNTLNENRQVLEVADTETIKKFLSSCSEETEINQEIIIPYALLYISDQVFLEKLYNRFVNNLFMWESSVPNKIDSNPKVHPNYNDFQTQLTNFDQERLTNTSFSVDREQGFLTCQSIRQDFDDHSFKDNQISSDNEDDHDGRSTPRTTRRKAPHAVVLQLQIDRIHIFANAPSADKTPKESRTSASNTGEFQIDGQGLSLGLVSSYSGDPSIEYLTLMIQSVLMYHNGRGTPLKSTATLNDVVTRSLPELLTRLPPNAFPKYNNNGTMVRAAFDIRTTGDRNEGKQKLIRGAYMIEGIMLHQRIVPKPESWILQLIELFDLTDDDVPGYIPSSSILDCHVEFRHCAVHYQPVHLDTRCYFAIESLALSNTYVKNSKTILLEFNLNDWALYLSKQKRDKNLIDLNDYVSIIYGQAFEMTLRLNEPTEGEKILEPLVDVRFGCNMIQIRCCSDSGNAFIELLKYTLADGDLQTMQQNTEASRSSTPIEKKRTSLPIRMVSDGTVHESQSTKDEAIDQIRLLADAMEDTCGSSPKFPRHSTSTSCYNDEDDDENGLSTSQMSNGQCGSVFSTSVSSESGSSPSPRNDRNKSRADNRDFEFIEREIGMCRPPKDGVYEVHVLTDSPIQIDENHFSKPSERNDILNAPAHLPVPVLRVSMRHISVVWFIYGGSDFARPKPSDTYQQPVQLGINDSVQFKSKINSSPLSQEKANAGLFNPFDQTPRLARHERGGPCRDMKTSMEFSITKARCQFETYDEREQASTRFVFAIHEFEIRDRLLTKSEFNKFLYLYTTEAVPRRTHADMLVFKVLYTKPESYMMRRSQVEFENGLEDQQSSEPLECEIKVSLQPLRINIDQDTLVFMRKFFTQMATTTVTRETSMPTSVNDQNLNNTTINEYRSGSFDSDTSFSPSSRSNSSSTLNTTTMSSDSSTTSNSPVFIKHFVFSPPCTIRIDYHGKLSNEQLFDSGPFLNFLIGLAQVSKFDIHLKRISYKKGLSSYEKLLAYILNEWLNDIRTTDVIKVMGPVSSLTQLATGIKDLVYLPIDQYNRDGRVLRGIQRGASSFTANTALAIIELSSQMVRCAHFAAQFCFELVSSSPAVEGGVIGSSSATSGNQSINVRNHSAPSDIREGVAYAVYLFRQSFHSTSHRLRTEAELGRQRKGIVGLIVAVLRQVPSVAIQPIVTTTRAAENVFDGVRNQIDRDGRNDSKEKFRS